MSVDFEAKNIKKAKKASVSDAEKNTNRVNTSGEGLTQSKQHKYAVSVCVPVYNAEKYLEKCLDSLINQSLKNLQIVCVDDGSTDNSLKILNSYEKYENIKIIHQENQGLGGARNTGIKNADGEYIGFMDADDYAEKDMYEKLYELAKKNSCDIALCNLEFTNQNTKKHLWYKPYKGKIDGNFLDRNIQPWNKIVSKKLIEETNFEFFPKNGDDMFIVLMLNANGIISTDEKLYHYRIADGSMSTSFKAQNFTNFIECTKAQIDKYHSSKCAGKLDEYFDYRMIYVLIQSLAVFAMKKEKQLFRKTRKQLNTYKYKQNPFMKTLLKNEFSKIEYFGMVYILPKNYYLSSLMMQLKLSGWS